jgi:hypothetical protein
VEAAGIEPAISRIIKNSNGIMLAAGSSICKNSSLSAYFVPESVPITQNYEYHFMNTIKPNTIKIIVNGKEIECVIIATHPDASYTVRVEYPYIPERTEIRPKDDKTPYYRKFENKGRKWPLQARRRMI